MSRSKTIAITNAKGGVGKTFLSVHLAYLFATRHKKKTLLIDTDTQGHVSIYYKKTIPHLYTIGDLISRTVPFDEIVIAGDHYDLIPSNELLAKIEGSLFGTIAREKALYRALVDNDVYNNYDIIIFDTSPSISLINQNVIIASDYYLIPVNLEPLGYAGCLSTIEFVNTLKKLIGIEISLLGIVPNMVSLTSNISKEMLGLYQGKFGDLCLHPIKQSVKVKEAVTAKETVFEYDDNNQVCKDLIDLSDEILKKIEVQS